jgi:fructose-1,6-bisphosphatase I
MAHKEKRAFNFFESPVNIIQFSFLRERITVRPNSSMLGGAEMLDKAQPVDLEAFLSLVQGRLPDAREAARIVCEIAAAAEALAGRVRLGPLSGRFEGHAGSSNFDGDAQKELDLHANEIFIAALRDAGAGVVLSEELEEPLSLDRDGAFAVAIDPLDGSSNIETNASIGTIFSILPKRTGNCDLNAHFLQPGHRQIAAGFAIYGPQTSLVLAFHGEPTQIFIWDGVRYRRLARTVHIPERANEYAINASNYRHWNDPVRAFVDDCVQGAEGPLRQNHNMRWIASLVADAYRILWRGGVYLYPGDRRPNYHDGRLRLVYEANPLALVVEQAGGMATDGIRRILDVTPSRPHARIPLVFGSSNLVELVSRYHADPQFSAERAPLFGKRGLMRL